MFIRTSFLIGVAVAASQCAAAVAGKIDGAGPGSGGGSSGDSGRRIFVLSDGHTPFATFEANNRSYSMVFKSVMTGRIQSGEVNCNGRLHNSPQPLYEAMIEECNIYGEILPTVETAQPTNQLLVASAYYNCGQDFIFVDMIDKDDELQRCIQHVKEAAIQRGFGIAVDGQGKEIESKISAASSLNIGSVGLLLSMIYTGFLVMA
jgi:hypothetical protein